ncbi:Nitroreductase [Xylaria intraflava]|nr:Nitroreductase [Xylaria intraflava]
MSKPDLTTLLQSRYGSLSASSSSAESPAAQDGAIPLNPILETILKHRSCRNFLPNHPLPPGTPEILVAAAQSAATSSQLQTWSAVAVSDPLHKDRVASLAGDQYFIRDASLFFVFCADLDRLTTLSARHGLPGIGLEFTDMFLVASLDAALAGQNAALTAESMGLGICYVGAVRNRAAELSELLRLPDRVVPVFGLAVGVFNPASKANDAAVKPRLPQSVVLRRETWDGGSKGGTNEEGSFEAYNHVMAEFNVAAGRGEMPSWTQRSAQIVEKAASLHGRHVLKDTLLARGFEMR